MFEQVQTEKLMTQAELLKKLLEDMMRLGWPRERAQEALDLAAHASAEACKAVERVMNATPDMLVMLQATILGGKLIENRMEFVVERTKALAELFTRQHEMDDEEFAAAARKVAEGGSVH